MTGRMKVQAFYFLYFKTVENIRRNSLKGTESSHPGVFQELTCLSLSKLAALFFLGLEC